NRLIKIREYNSPHLVDKLRKSVFYLGVGDITFPLTYNYEHYRINIINSVIPLKSQKEIV
ncbi:MAG: hypothetical protein KAS13_00040, partial [Candidatus Omnitrophica bacterium]|nr:hypothetical protein [Candidatus Omnitrophota bacterium]